MTGSKTLKSCTGDNVLPHYKITDQRLEEQMKKTCIEQDCYYVIILENLLNVILPSLYTTGTQN